MAQWLSSRTIQEVMVLTGLFTALIAAIATLISAKLNRKAILSEEIVASLRSQIELIKQQSTQTETNLKEQLSYYKELSPAEIQKQLTAVKILLTDRVQVLEQQLDESNRLMREKTTALSEVKLAEATAMGYGKIFLGINDAEIFTRSLFGLVTSYGQIVDFGEADLNVKSFYVGIMRLIIKNDEFLSQFATKSPEWILDYLIQPMLSCVKYKSLERAITESLDAVFVRMRDTPFAKEIPIYEEALARAKAGEDFSSMNLPRDLAIKMLKVSNI